MNTRLPTQTQTKPSSFTPVPTGLLQRKCLTCGQHTLAGGGCSECSKKQKLLQRRTKKQPESSEVPPIVHEVLSSPGQPLDAQTRNFMQSRFNRDFSGVRIHTDAKAAESAQAVNAHAYTVGGNIVFDSGQYAPETATGKRLLTHEMTHVVQQLQGQAADVPVETPLRISNPDDVEEREASQFEESVPTGENRQIQSGVVSTILQRQASGTTTPATATTTGQTATQQQQPTPPPRRSYYNYQRSGFGRFDASLESRGRPNRAGTSGWLCALNITTRVKFDFDNSNGTWPPGRAQQWQQEFINLVAQRWSTRYLLVPTRSCAGEGCAMTVVYVNVEPVTSGEHHQVKIYYTNPTNARSHAGIPDRIPAEFYEEDIRRSGVINRQTTAAHEAGHWFGLQHIRCNSGDFYCYGITAGESDDVMGRGEFVSSRDYEPFIEVMHQLTSCDWRTEGSHGGIRAGSIALGLGLLGALGGGILGAAIGGGVGTMLGLGAAFGLAGAAIGFIFDVG